MSISSSDGNTANPILFHLIYSMNGRISKIRMKMLFLISSFMIHIASHRWVLCFFWVCHRNPLFLLHFSHPPSLFQSTTELYSPYLYGCLLCVQHRYRLVSFFCLFRLIKEPKLIFFLKLATDAKRYDLITKTKYKWDCDDQLNETNWNF